MIIVLRVNAFLALITAAMAVKFANVTAVPGNPNLALVIGSGSLVGDWMNNSGFWLFSRMNVLTETETLKSWTILTAALRIAGLIFTTLFAKKLPLV